METEANQSEDKYLEQIAYLKKELESMKAQGTVGFSNRGAVGAGLIG